MKPAEYWRNKGLLEPERNKYAQVVASLVEEMQCGRLKKRQVLAFLKREANLHLEDEGHNVYSAAWADIADRMWCHTKNTHPNRVSPEWYAIGQYPFANKWD